MEITLHLSPTSSIPPLLGSPTSATTAHAINSGDTIDISEQGRVFSAALIAGKARAVQSVAAEASEDLKESSRVSTLESLKKMIEKLKQELQELEEKDILEEDKERKRQELQTRLTQAQLQYAQTIGEGSSSSDTTLLSGLGSSAQGFGNSLT